MTTSYKKALSPAHPSEKRAGAALSPPPCAGGIPIYPLRYGVSERKIDSEIFPKLSTAGYPSLAGGKDYGLRVLRPGTYVYLFYFENERMWTMHHMVTADGRFARIWWSTADYESSTPGSISLPDTGNATTHLIAPETKRADTVYLLISETVLSHQTLWDLEDNKNGLLDKLATVVKPAGGPSQKHTLDAVLLGNTTRELVPPASYGMPSSYSWSEIKFSGKVPDYNAILGNMYIALVPCKEVKPVAVVLKDPIGIVSELHHLCADAVRKRDSWQLSNKHKLQSAALIDGYFKSVESSSTASTEAGTKALMRQRELVNLKGARAFRPSYESSLSKLNEQVKLSGNDVVSWARLLGEEDLAGLALKLFDLECRPNAVDYEMTVLNCLGALVHTDEGLKELDRIIETNPSDSHLWKALAAGDRHLLDRISSSLLIAKNVFSAVDKYVEQYAGTVSTQGLAGLLQHYVAAAPEAKAKVQIERLRHIAERRFSITLGFRLTSIGDYLRYAMELQGYLTLGEDAYAKWGLKALPTPGPLPGTTQVNVIERIEVWEWHTVDVTDVGGPPKPIPASENPLLKNLKRMKASALAHAERARGPVGVGFTGIGGVVAVWGMRSAMTELSKERNATTVATALGAGAALVASSIEIGTLVAAAAVKRGGGSAASATAIKAWGFKWGTTVAGSAAAGLLAMADGMRAINSYDDSNPEQARMYLGAAISGGVVAVATAMGATTVSLGPVSITPLGWLVIAAAGVVATIWFTLEAGDAAHSPVEIWLKHSAWGVNARRFTLNQELEAWHSLHFRPRINAKWESSGDTFVSRFFSNAGTLRLRCTLPNTSANEHFESKLHVTLRGKKLSPIDPAVLKSQGSFMLNLDENYFAAPLTNNQGIERGWSIAMHEDAQVQFEYLYLPDRQSMPDVALLQQGAPKPLLFTSGSMFSSPIDAEDISPVTAPK
ncbi:toxin VasX [Pseudomonas aeruginosa]